MEFAVLGPVRVSADGAAPVLAARQRTLLAALLMRPGAVVPVDTLIEALWGETPPGAARNTTQGYVKRLRQQLGPQAGGRVVTADPGYLIRVQQGELDLDVFTGRCETARTSALAGDWVTAAGELRRALALFRGDPLADVASALLIRDEVPRLAELRMRALESRIEADLRLGRHDDLTGELRGLAAAHPMRERFHAQLLLALYRAGRRGEALAAYAAARQVLRRELGIEPGAELRRLHQLILAGDPALDLPASRGAGGLSAPAGPGATGAAGPGAGPSTGGPSTAGPSTAGLSAIGRGAAASPAGATEVPTPAQLPPDTPDFTGRDEQVARACAVLTAAPGADRPGAVPVWVVAGMGGAGKTTLAVHVAHRIAGQFPDGQLYAGLRGATSPLRPADVLARFLRALGAAERAIPADEAERAAAFRTRLAGRRTLIVLDDVADAAQVRPLLPGTAGCAVIVTSRRALPGLPGAAALTLGGLEPDAARELFGAIVGQQRATAEPDAADQVLAACAGLPLAVRIAASRLATRPGWSIAQLGARLRDERRRLAELTVGDLAIRACFAVSYDALPAVAGPASAAGPDRSGPDSSGPDRTGLGSTGLGSTRPGGGAAPARIFRLLGLADAPEHGLPAIAALAGLPADAVLPALDLLADAHLLDSPAPDRYRLHDLLRDYAAERADQEEDPGERRAALTRMLRWYVREAILAAKILVPTGRLPASMLAVTGSSLVETPKQALDWFQDELPGLLAVVPQAAALSLHEVAAQTAVAMWAYFRRRSSVADWQAVSEAGMASARLAGDDPVLAWLLNSLGQAHSDRGHFAESGRCFAEALEIRRRLGDRSGEAVILNCMGIDLSSQDRNTEALELMRQSANLHAGLGEQAYVAIGLNNIGDVLLRLKRHDEALDYLMRALALHEEAGDVYDAGITHVTIGETYFALGRLAESVRHYRLALAAHSDDPAGHPYHAHVLVELGTALDRLGREAEAVAAWQTVLPILDRRADQRATGLRARLRELGEPAGLG
ncbi:MAG TPA: BTAD domain-containing putative transcriptional regulator [Streptosporangiaceae bacterium]